MRVVADLQLHSRYARAVSSQMNVPTIAEWAVKKGVGLVATGDWTHPLWLKELEGQLREVGEGVYGYKDNPTKFLLGTEISSIYSQGGRTRRVHTLVWAPSFEVVEKINQELARRGCNLWSDGRPIVGLSCRQLAEIILGVERRCVLIPAHAWTPWFSVYGANGGFDSLQEAFGKWGREIRAIETGLSSDPAMNWRIGELDNRSIVSFSDAHSPAKLGREATVFEVEELTYDEIAKLQVAYTIEFYPEEGKYHYSGHRGCGVVQKGRGVCGVCGKSLTTGVMARVEELATRPEIEKEKERDKFGVEWCRHPQGSRPPFVRMVPLIEILMGCGVKGREEKYADLVGRLGGEMRVLLTVPIEEIARIAGEKMGEGVARVRAGEISVRPGYDGVYGKVSVWGEAGGLPESRQRTLF